MTAKTKWSFVDLDAGELAQLLERAKAVLLPQDSERVELVVQTLLEVTRLVRRQGAKIAQLRRLLGWSSSEKTADVLSGTAPAADRSNRQGGNVDSSARNASAGVDGADGDGACADQAGTNRDQDAPKSKAEGHGRIPASAYPNAHRIDIAHQRLRVGDLCPGCAHGTLYQLKHPSRIVRIVGQPPLAAYCWNCQRLRCSACTAVFTAQTPAEAQGPKYADSAASMMGILRYGAGMPLNRLERLQRNLGVPVPASTQWQVVRDRLPAPRHVYDELCRVAAGGRLLHNDDTHARILELMGKRRAALLAAGKLPDPDRTGLFTTAIVAVTNAGPVALFFTGRKHAGENLKSILDARHPELGPPIQMCDGLERNLPKNHQVIESNCMSHGRRHFVDEVENFPDQCRHVLEQLGIVFKNEELCGRDKLCATERMEFHQRQSGPILDELEKWLRAELDEKRVEPNSGLGEAFNYLLKRWNKLTQFLRVPHAPLENNICERALKVPIRHRNNSYFFRTLRGAHVGDIYMSLIYTAELHGENAFDYLSALFQHEANVQANPAAWLPWNYRVTLAAAYTGRAA